MKTVIEMAKKLHNTLAVYNGAGYAMGWKTDKVDRLLDESKRVIEASENLQPAQRKPLTDEEIEALLPEPDGTAEVDSVRVLVAPGLYGTEYSEADAWTKESVIQVARAIEAAHGIKENT